MHMLYQFFFLAIREKPIYISEEEKSKRYPNGCCFRRNIYIHVHIVPYWV